MENEGTNALDIELGDDITELLGSEPEQKEEAEQKQEELQDETKQSEEEQKNVEELSIEDLEKSLLEEHEEDSEEPNIEEPEEEKQEEKPKTEEELIEEELKKLEKPQDIEIERKQIQEEQENFKKNIQIEQGLLDIEKKTQELISANTQLEDYEIRNNQAFQTGQISQQDYVNNTQVIAQSRAQIQTQAQQLVDVKNKLVGEKNEIPSIINYADIAKAKEANDIYFNNFVKEEKINNKNVLKHISKLKQNRYDKGGYSLEEGNAFKEDVNWISSIHKDGYDEGYRKALEKIHETKAKGKVVRAKSKAEGKTREAEVNVDDITKGDVDTSDWF